MSLRQRVLHRACGDVAGHSDVEELVAAVGEYVGAGPAHDATLPGIVIPAKAGISPFRRFPVERAEPRPSPG